MSHPRPTPEQPADMPDGHTHWRRIAADGVTLWAYPGVGHDDVMEECFDEHSVRLYTGLREGRVAFDSDAVRPERWAPLTAVYRPPGSSFRHDCQRAADIVEVRIAAGDLGRLLGERVNHSPLPHVVSAIHLQPLVADLHRLVYAGDAPDPMALESAALAFWGLALEGGSCPSADSSERRRSLAQPALGRVLDRVEAELDGPLSLSDLAETAGLNVHHFAKAFAATTGVTPHQHVLHRRLSRARLLLQHAALSITDVALATGFSSQSHLTSSLRRHVGVTPARYRRSARGH